MAKQLEQLVSSLLYEGYALYPYTPGATKNATPTPFGIVYPPAYASRNPSTFDHLRIECVLEARRRTRGSSGTVRFLQAAGERHQATSDGSRSRRAARRAARPRVGQSSASRASPRCAAGLGSVPSDSAAGLAELRCASTTRDRRVRPGGVERAEALARQPALHPRRDRGRAARSSRRSSARARGRGASAERQHLPRARLAATTRLGAAIVLPDHPRMAPRASATCSTTPRSRRRSCCTSRRSRPERERDRASRTRRCARWSSAPRAATPEEIVALHGMRLEPTQPPGAAATPTPATSRGDDRRASRSEGARRSSCGPGTDRDVYDRMLDGRTATIERIYIDYDDERPRRRHGRRRPRAGAFRETGRYLFFKPARSSVGARRRPMSSARSAERHGRPSRSWSPASATPG